MFTVWINQTPFVKSLLEHHDISMNVRHGKVIEKNWTQLAKKMLTAGGTQERFSRYVLILDPDVHQLSLNAQYITYAGGQIEVFPAFEEGYVEIINPV